MLNFKKYIQVYTMLKSLPSISPKDTIARNAVEEALGLTLLVQNPGIYEQLRVEFFVFYTLFAQNTRDEFSKKILFQIHDKFRSSGYVYDLVQYEQFFYKHKKENFNAMIELLLLLKRGEIENVEYGEFLKIRRIGYKSAALLYNEFFQSDTYPVVDINVYRGYLSLMSVYELPKLTANQLFLELLALNNFCDSNIGFELSSLLYSYRKYLKLKLKSDGFPRARPVIL